MVPSLQKTVLPVRKKRPPAQPFARAACFFCNFDCAVYPLPSFRLSDLSLTVISTARFTPYRHFDCAGYPLPSFRLSEANGEISLSGLLFCNFALFCGYFQFGKYTVPRDKTNAHLAAKAALPPQYAQNTAHIAHNFAGGRIPIDGRPPPWYNKNPYKRQKTLRRRAREKE